MRFLVLYRYIVTIQYIGHIVVNTGESEAGPWTHRRAWRGPRRKSTRGCLLVQACQIQWYWREIAEWWTVWSESILRRRRRCNDRWPSPICHACHFWGNRKSPAVGTAKTCPWPWMSMKWIVEHVIVWVNVATVCLGTAQKGVTWRVVVEVSAQLWTPGWGWALNGTSSDTRIFSCCDRGDGFVCCC